MKHNKLRRLVLKSSKILIPVLIVAILLSTITLAKVNSKWDWHKVDGGQHKRKIHWCWCPDAFEYLATHQEWIPWMVDAAANWNNANTGWELEYTSDQEKCQLCITFGDIPCPGSGSARDITDDGRLKKGRITFDTNLSNNPVDPASGWGTSGADVYNPVVVGKHELGHFLRLRHGSGNDKMDVDKPGNHNTTLSPHDIQEAKDSYSSTGRKIRNVFRPFGYFESDNGDIIFIPEGALPGEDSLIFCNTINWEIPCGTNVENSYISTAIEISTDSGFLNLPIGVYMSYTDWEINGGYVCYVEQYYPPLIETELKIYKYNPDAEMWQLYPHSVVDPSVNQVIFETIDLGLYGISGPPEYEIIPPGRPDKPSGPPSGSAGKEYTYKTTSINPEGDLVYYWFDWGDGSGTGWIGPYEPGEPCQASHIWDEQGHYEIKVRAENEWGWESDWSDPLSVTMPRNRASTSPFLNFLQNHLNLFPIIRLLIQRLGLQ